MLAAGECFPGSARETCAPHGVGWDIPPGKEGHKSQHGRHQGGSSAHPDAGHHLERPCKRAHVQTHSGQRPNGRELGERGGEATGNYLYLKGNPEIFIFSYFK